MLLYGLTFVVTAIGIGIIVTVDGSFLLSQAPTALIKGIPDTIESKFLFLHKRGP